METDLCFNYGIDLPEFASYDLLRTESGRQVIVDYYRSYIELARRYGLGLVLETPTWRANADWGRKLGDDADALRELNRASVELLRELRDATGDDAPPLVISGCLGPRGDGYTPGSLMTAEEARVYHGVQIETFAGTCADMVAALTLNYVEEATGVAMAARDFAMPVCISFTVETDGRLPGGTELAQAVEAVDSATDGWPAYYMINCAHPTHFDHLFMQEAGWLQRLKGLRGNASCMSHAELDNCETLDDGNPVAFGVELNALREHSPSLTVLGGCCGTDLRHIENICRQLSAANRRPMAMAR